jgi:hypothetical protein
MRGTCSDVQHRGAKIETTSRSSSTNDAHAIPHCATNARRDIDALPSLPDHAVCSIPELQLPLFTFSTCHQQQYQDEACSSCTRHPAGVEPLYVGFQVYMIAVSRDSRVQQAPVVLGRTEGRAATTSMAHALLQLCIYLLLRVCYVRP